MRAWIYKEPRGYSVWLVSPHTGDKKECLGSFDSKREALRVQRIANRPPTDDSPRERPA